MSNGDDYQQTVQQINEDRAQYEQMQAQDRARQAVAGKIPKTTDISGVEFMLIGLVAVVKDSLDIIVTVTIIGAIFTTIINVGATLILWLWCIFKLKKFPFKRFLGSGILEFIPGLDVLPAWTAFVLSLFLEQRGYIPKFVQKLTKPTGK